MIQLLIMCRGINNTKFKWLFIVVNLVFPLFDVFTVANNQYI